MELRGWPHLWCVIALGLFLVATSSASDNDSAESELPPSPLSELDYGDSTSDEIQVNLGSKQDEEVPYTPFTSEVDSGCSSDYWLDSDACTCCPGWTARAGLVYLRRDHQTDRLLSNGATPIRVDGLAFDYEAGPMFSVIRHGFLQSAWDLEVTYFGVHDFNAAATSLAATTILTIPNINFGPTTVNSNYSSELDSTEINFRQPWNDWLILMGGFRWIEIGDQLVTNVLASSHTIDVNNHLYGAQLGAEALVLSRGAFLVDLLGKAGIYHNQADQSTAIVNVGGAVPLFSANDSETAFVGELALTGTYLINDRWSARAGYQVLWVDGVELAPDQINVSNVATGAAVLDTTGDPIYHGLALAVEFVR